MRTIYTIIHENLIELFKNVWNYDKNLVLKDFLKKYIFMCVYLVTIKGKNMENKKQTWVLLYKKKN